MSNQIRKKLLIAAGFFFVALGIIGIFVPVMPTTPFLLLAAACFLRSSEKFYRWLMNNKLLGNYISNYIEGRGMPVRSKIITIALLLMGIGFSMYVVWWNPIVVPILGIIAVMVTRHIARIKPKHRDDRPAREIFDDIAPGWYGFRHHSIFRHELEQLGERWGRGKLINIGCAHGPDFIPFKENFELHGVDISPAMLEMARKYAAKHSFNVHLTEADTRHLPYEDNTFDWAIAVAVFHHVKGSEGRLEAFQETRRVLKPGGEAFITAWNRWQPRFWFKGKNTLVPWRSGDKVINRYYYLYSSGELIKTARQAGFEVLKVFPESRFKFPVKTFSRNICLVVRKNG